MERSEKRNTVLAAAVTAVLLGASVLYAVRHPGRTVYAVQIDLLVMSLLCIVCMASALKTSLRSSFYTYKNIGLIGGILFAAVFACVFLSYFVIWTLGEGTTVRDIYHSIVRFPRQFSYGTMLVILVLCALLAVSNVALIRHEGFCLNNALCLLLTGFYVGGTAVIYWITDRLLPKPQSGLLLALSTAASMFLLIMLCYFECILVGTAIMGWLAARRPAAHDKDFIIILGCSIDKRGGLLPLLKGRVNRAIRFAWEQEIETGKPAHYVPSGGQGANEVISEGSAMELYLMTRGAESYEIFPEKASKNTWENFCFSKKVIEAQNPEAKVAFATTNYHILRSGILARRAGLDAEGIAGDTKWYFWPNGFTREFFGILALTTRTHILFAAVTAAGCLLMGAAGYAIGYL